MIKDKSPMEHYQSMARGDAEGIKSFALSIEHLAFIMPQLKDRTQIALAELIRVTAKQMAM